MEIKRIYKPDIHSQMRAIMLILRIRLPPEPTYRTVGKAEEAQQQPLHPKRLN